MKLKLAVFLTSAMLMSTAFAENRLNLPEGVTVVYQNGKEVKTVGSMRLPDGHNQLVMKYWAIPGGPQSNNDIVESDALVVEFKAANQSIDVLVPKIRRSRDMERFNNKQDIRLQTSSGAALDTKVTALKTDGLLIGRDYAQEMRAFNRDSFNNSGATPVVHNYGQNPSSIRTASGSQSQASVTSMPESMLMYWYQQADDDARARFKAWINSQ